jgi:hypothetical protein
VRLSCSEAGSIKTEDLEVRISSYKGHDFRPALYPIVHLRRSPGSLSRLIDVPFGE